MSVQMNQTSTMQLTNGTELSIQKTYSFQDIATTEFVYDTYAIPGTTTNFQLNLGRITTAKYIYIETNQPITVMFNDTATINFPVSKFVMLNTSATAIYITNANSVVATVNVVISGV